MNLTDPTIGKDREDTSVLRKCWMSEDVDHMDNMVVDRNWPEERWVKKSLFDKYVLFISKEEDYSPEEKEGLLNELKAQL